MTDPAAPTPPPLDDLGVVVPTIDEAAFLPDLLDDLHTFVPPHRVVVVDGGSIDDTPRLAADAGVRVLVTPPSRGGQLNAGAEILGTKWILFLHADSRVPRETRLALRRWLVDPPPCEAAHFHFALRESRWYGPWLRRGQRVREVLTGLAYGDQGLVISKRRFQEVGGYPELPVMEDVGIIRSLRRSGGVARIDAPLPTSARRYDETGPIRAWLRNASLLALFQVRVPARHLARLYAPRRHTTPADAPAEARPGSERSPS